MLTTRKISGVTVNECSRELSWRLVHDGSRVIDLFESVGITSTINTLFTGTEAECRAEVKRLGLVEVVAE